jgi:UDP-3-O-[3-hydroxymyristoyl] glucosamine N-acyltransferase
MSTRLRDLVERFGGQLVGDPDIKVSSIAPIDVANASHITFLSNPKFRAKAAQSAAAALILSPADDEIVAASYKGARIITANPYAYFARAAQFFVQQKQIPPTPGVHSTACVHPTAQIAASASIGPHVTIEAGAVIADEVVIDAGCVIGRGAKIGAKTHFFPRVVFLDACEIGENGIIYPGAVIGSDGFGLANDGGVWVKIPQTGRVLIGNDVQIGANTTVDRGALIDTVIEDGVKLDNQIQIGHNCHIGAHTAMAGCVGVGGSSIIGKHCTLGGAVGVAGHLTIADNVHVTAASNVSRSILEPGHYAGSYPIAKHDEWQKTAAVVRNLTAMRERVRELEKTIKTLTEN